jgi:hypothetical protein
MGDVARALCELLRQPGLRIQIQAAEADHDSCHVAIETFAGDFETFVPLERGTAVFEVALWQAFENALVLVKGKAP